MASGLLQQQWQQQVQDAQQRAQAERAYQYQQRGAEAAFRRQTALSDRQHGQQKAMAGMRFGQQTALAAWKHQQQKELKMLAATAKRTGDLRDFTMELQKRADNLLQEHLPIRTARTNIVDLLTK